MRRLSAASLLLASVALGCGDDGGGDASDATVDSGPEDTGPVDTGLPPFDSGYDSGFVFPDAGPAPTGCELIADAGDAGGDAGALDGGVDAGPDPAPLPDAHPAILGPGGPATSFTAGQLNTACAYLDGGERDRDHHNTVLMLDGYLYMPWAHEGGVGGLSVFEFDDPCSPVPVATVVEEEMRETHAAGIASMNGRRYMVTTSLTGILFWDVTDPTMPMLLRVADGPAHDM